jgi:mRNA interferase RelE/StbE
VSYKVALRRSATKELATLSSENQTRVARALIDLASNPFPTGVKKLKARNGYRIRVGDYRIVYTVERDLLIISAIGHRSEVYR